MVMALVRDGEPRRRTIRRIEGIVATPKHSVDAELKRMGVLVGSCLMIPDVARFFAEDEEVHLALTSRPACRCPRRQSAVELSRIASERARSCSSITRSSSPNSETRS